MQTKDQNRLIIFHTLHPKAREYLQRHLKGFPNLQVSYYESITPSTKLTPQIKDDLRNADVLMGYYFPRSWLTQTTKLKLIISPFAGVKPLVKSLHDLQSKNPQFNDVILTNSHGNAQFVAQHAISLLMTLTGEIFHHHTQMKRGIWHFKEEIKESIPLTGKQIGLLGYGAINQKVHQFLAGFPVKFGALKQSWTHQSEPRFPLAKYVSSDLDRFLRDSDIIIIALPLTEKTQNLIGEREMKLMGKDSILINMARGGIVEEKALYSALNQKWIHSAGIDVWYNYNPEPNDKGQKFPYTYPFHKLDNIVLSPHRADSPFQELTRWNDIIQNIETFITQKGNFVNQVDMKKGY